MRAQHQPKLSLSKIARIFLKVGATAFGGWSTTAVLLEKELVGKRGILQVEHLHGAVAYAQILPGGTQVCIAANVGYRLYGLSGAFVATVGFLLPGISMIVAFAVAYFHFSSSHVMSHASGLIAALSGIILANAMKIGDKHAVNIPLWAVVGVAFAARIWLRANTLLLISIFAIGGLAVNFVQQSKKQESIHD
ncbi:MAG TPA: chromate transporter [Candidatus Saccharimonadales bacterium]|nr:chromate transporter [Candidatus Saccharimonadales bacterium]